MLKKLLKSIRKIELLETCTGVCKSNESESVSVLCYELVFHHKWADAQFFVVDAQFFVVDAQFFGADAQFFGADVQFFRADTQFFAAGLL